MTRFLTPQRIHTLAADPARCTQPIAIGAIDYSRPFIHENYTQLYYTPFYERMSFEQRLTYNQLFAVRTNEFIMMLERDFVDHILLPLRRHARVTAKAHLAECLDIMIAEERRHYAFFVDLNRRSLPGVFESGRERFFSQLSWPASAMFYLLGLVARRFAFPMWFFMAMEESSISLARVMVERPTTESLGELEPHWVAVHREHTKDEVRHLHIDAHLIEACIGRSGPVVRRVDAFLFQHILSGGLTRPERSGSGVKVVRHLVHMHPELKPLEEDMVGALLALRSHSGFQKSLFNRKIMPITFGMFDATPELANLPRHMVGYERERI